ncbi:hypothetical protein QZH41_006958 [Actinostola sp. cb2023]|nr:hypothetical protein QZH41_006958 [Actinostola sp. cb2023]
MVKELEELEQDHAEEIPEQTEVSEKHQKGNEWMISKVVDGKTTYVHISRAIKLLLPREYIARCRQKRHFASKYLPGKAPLDSQHNVVRFGFVAFKVSLKCKKMFQIGRIEVIESTKDGKEITSFKLKSNAEARARVSVFLETEQEGIYCVPPQLCISSGKAASAIIGPVELIPIEKGRYKIHENSLEILKKIGYLPFAESSFQKDDDSGMTKQDPEEMSLEDGFYEVENILERRIAKESLTYEYKVKFKGYGEEDNMWLPASSFNQAINFTSTSRYGRKRKYTIDVDETSRTAAKKTSEIKSEEDTKKKQEKGVNEESCPTEPQKRKTRPKPKPKRLSKKPKALSNTQKGKLFRKNKTFPHKASTIFQMSDSDYSDNDIKCEGRKGEQPDSTDVGETGRTTAKKTSSDMKSQEETKKKQEKGVNEESCPTEPQKRKTRPKPKPKRLSKKPKALSNAQKGKLFRKNKTFPHKASNIFQMSDSDYSDNDNDIKCERRKGEQPESADVGVTECTSETSRLSVKEEYCNSFAQDSIKDENEETEFINVESGDESGGPKTLNINVQDSVEQAIAMDIRRRDNNFVTPRRLLAQTVLPPVDFTLSMTGIKLRTNESVTDPQTVDRIPPDSVLKDAMNSLRKKLNSDPSASRYGVLAEFPLYGCFTLEGLRILSRYHLILKIKREVNQEIQWIDDAFITISEKDKERLMMLLVKFFHFFSIAYHNLQCLSQYCFGLLKLREVQVTQCLLVYLHVHVQVLELLQIPLFQRILPVDYVAMHLVIAHRHNI